MPLCRLVLALGLPALGLLAPLAPAPAWAETSLAAADLGQVLRLDDLFAILHDEGMAYGQDLGDDMGLTEDSASAAAWTAEIASLNDPAVMRARFDGAFAATLGDDPPTLAAIADFYRSPTGQKVLASELDARRAFLDIAAEEAARVANDVARTGRDPRAAMIDRLIDAGDLVEMNVAGSLSGSLAFMTGFRQTAPASQVLPADNLASEVWADEARVRADTTSWMQAYLGLACLPLSEAELAAYVDFAESPAGRRLASARFAGFDAVFLPISHQLGRATGLALQGSHI